MTGRIRRQLAHESVGMGRVGGRRETEIMRYNSYRREQVRRVLNTLRSRGLWGFFCYCTRIVQFRYRIGGLKGVLFLGALGSGTGQMARDWDNRARLNARYFVASDHWRTEEEFYLSGERVLSEKLLQNIELAPSATTLEIGCGIGRLLKPIGAMVQRAIGIDVSPEMVRICRETLVSIPSVEVLLGDGRSLQGIRDQSVDFCYSYVVFQHLPQLDILTSYFHEVFRVVVPGGLFRFQAKGVSECSQTIDYGGTLMGILVSRALLSRLLENVGLTVLEMTGHRSDELEDLWVTAKREPRAGEGCTEKVLYRPGERTNVHR